MPDVGDLVTVTLAVDPYDETTDAALMAYVPTPIAAGDVSGASTSTGTRVSPDLASGGVRRWPQLAPLRAAFLRAMFAAW